MSVSMNSIVTKTWQERQADHRQDCENNRAIIFESYVSNQPFIRSGCDRCKKVLDSIAIRWMTFKKHFFDDCDYVLHSLLHFHRRYLASLEILKPLSQVNSLTKIGVAL
uniref:Uncharacterized protein n=1 Tax=Daphnia galeata TaxID=27404 RepID=A0A8J2W4Q6_9CRUS|nr:unnamed protein product [Daphnia galeata]